MDENKSVKLGSLAELFEVKPKRAQRSLAKGEYDPEVKARIKRRKRQRRYYEKNRERLNRKRRGYLQSPKGQWTACKRRAAKAGQAWELSFEDWWELWTEAPKCFDLEANLLKPAYLLRGNNPIKNTQMRRKDTSKGWTVDNVEIIYKNQPIPESGMVPDWSVDEGRALTWEEMKDELKRIG